MDDKDQIVRVAMMKHHPRLMYLVNMIDDAQYVITFSEYEALRERLESERLGGVYIIRPNPPEEVIITIRNIVSLHAIAVEQEEYDG